MRIDVDGHSYGSWEELPEHLRRQLEATGMMGDADGDGVPDLFQGRMPPGLPTAAQFSVDGQVFGSLDQLPPEQQARARAALAGLTGVAGQTAPPGAPGAPGPVPATPPSAPPPQPVAYDPTAAGWAPPPGQRVAAPSTSSYPGVIVENRSKLPGWLKWMLLIDVVIAAVVLWIIFG